MARRRAASVRGRFAPVAWIGGAASALLLTLGVNGTLASWTSAIITNDTNNVATANSVILKETGPGATPAVCSSSDGTGSTNTFTCSTINKYGGTGTPLSPGQSQAVTVTLQNVGTTSGALTLSAAGCSTSGGASGAPSMCSQMQVKVECPTGTAVYPATGTGSLNAFNTATGTTPAAVKTLAATASVACTFTLSLPDTTSPVYAGQTASQQLTWTLTAAP